LALINVGAILYACYEAFIARDVSTEYAESEFIFKSMATVLVVCFIGIPVSILTQNNATAFNCAVAGIVCACSLSFQLFIFVPKIKFHQSAKAGEMKTSNIFRRSRNQDSQFSADGAPNNDGFSADASACSTEDGGMLIFNTRQMRKDLKEENAKLLKQNKKLEREIKTLKKANRKKGDDDSHKDPWKSRSVSFADVSSDMDSGPPSLAAFPESVKNSALEMDPISIDHEDQSRRPAVSDCGVPETIEVSSSHNNK